MSRYIDVDNLADRLLNAWDTADKEKKTEISAIIADIVTPILIGTPTADVKEVIHGEWIKMSDVDGKYYACSNCGQELPRSCIVSPTVECPYGEYESIEPTLFCPNCGSDMRGGKR